MALTLNGTTGIVTPGVTDTGNLSVSGTTALTTPLPVTSGGTGATSLSGITTGTATNLAGGSAGTVPYQSSSGTTAMLAAGTSGQVLTSAGASAPTWATPATGALTFLSAQTVSTAVANLNFSNVISSTYDDYLILLDNIQFSGTGRFLSMRLQKGGVYVSTSTYVFSGLYLGANTAPAGASGATTAISRWYFACTASGTATTTNVISGNMELQNANSVDGTTTINYKLSQMGLSAATGDNWGVGFGGGRQSTASATTGMQFYEDGGANFTSGTIRVYGVQKS